MTRNDGKKKSLQAQVEIPSAIVDEMANLTQSQMQIVTEKMNASLEIEPFQNLPDSSLVMGSAHQDYEEIDVAQLDRLTHVVGKLLTLKAKLDFHHASLKSDQEGNSIEDSDSSVDTG